MDQRRYWGLVVALGVGFGSYGVVAPGTGGPVGVTPLGWAGLFVGLALVATGVWGYRSADRAADDLSPANHAVLLVAVLVVLVTIVVSSI